MKTSLIILSLVFITCPGTFSSKALLDANISGSEPIPRKKLGDSVFTVFRKMLPWADARAVCETEVGRLAVFPTKEDAEGLIKLIKDISEPYSEIYDSAYFQYEFGMDRRYWIGLTDMVMEGDWTWMDDGNKLSYDSLWYDGQPDHLIQHTNEHCVCLWNPLYYDNETHSWNDEDCLHKLYFICEDLTRAPDGKFYIRNSVPIV